MRVDSVEIFSDLTNAAVMRHPNRHFPGVLVQGDSLYVLCQKADQACQQVGRGSPGRLQQAERAAKHAVVVPRPLQDRARRARNRPSVFRTTVVVNLSRQRVSSPYEKRR